MEVLLSGGDPLVLGDKRLGEALRRIRAVRKELVIRIASRIPVVLPSRITAGLVDLLRRTAPLWLVTQYNHPRELTARSEDSLARLIDAGIPVLNQTVLLRGVNDDPGILAELFQRLVENRVKPYYLFQGDLAAGTSHFRLPIDEGLGIVRELRKRVSGMAMPVYAVDLPGGGGKVPLTEDYLLNPPGQTVSPQYSAGDEAAEPEGVRSAEPSSSSPAGRHRRGEDYLFRGPDGLVYRYPDEQ
ncbi:MAG: hypothetical protein K9L68_08265 [Spirochaetales bacterium]|nr:hypothetical protein [Spirochaetales bacterium]MCF7938577.1 hypothetical protein [Spirochaetales bacterium]